MLLYLWVSEYKNIKKTGFNLSSNYEFSFSIERETSNGLVKKGRLKCIKKNGPKIFDEHIEDIRAIIGENGSGKSTLLEVLVTNIMTRTNFFFDGFFVTNKYIFNRKEIDFGKSISKIKYFKLHEVSNTDLANYNRDQFQRKIKEKDINDRHNGQIATRHLKDLSIVHYSPLLNIDRISNIEGVAGSTKTWVTDYWHYYDLTTENCIVSDYDSLNIGEISYFISGESELLAFKSAESMCNLEFLSTDIFHTLPFRNHIEYITVYINDYYEKFWFSIEMFLTDKDVSLGKLTQMFTSIERNNLSKKNGLNDLESNIYKNLIYGALKYEYIDKMNFSGRVEKNVLIETINLLLSSARENNTYKAIFENFLKKAQFPINFHKLLLVKIDEVIDFIINSQVIENRSEFSFSIPVSNGKVIKEFIKLIYDDFVFGNEENKQAFIFHIFSIEFVGLSSGEKDLLSMFGRINTVVNTIPSTQTEIVFLLDEPEVTLHPQWQIKFIKLVNDNFPKLFPDKKLQIIISSHSPFIVSDLPKNNILFLKKNEKTGECKVSELKSINNTFGANIHSLYADAFFLKDSGGAIGEFAKSIILNIIDQIKEGNQENKTYLKSIIQIVGEPLIKNQLLDLFYEKYPEQRIDNIDERIKYLEERLKEVNEIKRRKNEENR